LTIILLFILPRGSGFVSSQRPLYLLGQETAPNKFVRERFYFVCEGEEDDADPRTLISKGPQRELSCGGEWSMPAGGGKGSDHLGRGSQRPRSEREVLRWRYSHRQPDLGKGRSNKTTIFRIAYLGLQRVPETWLRSCCWQIARMSGQNPGRGRDQTVEKRPGHTRQRGWDREEVEANPWVDGRGSGEETEALQDGGNKKSGQPLPVPVQQGGGGVTLSKESPGSGPAGHARLTRKPTPKGIESTVVIARAMPELFSYERPEGTLPHVLILSRNGEMAREIKMSAAAKNRILCCTFVPMVSGGLTAARRQVSGCGLGFCYPDDGEPEQQGSGMLGLSIRSLWHLILHLKNQRISEGF